MLVSCSDFRLESVQPLMPYLSALAPCGLEISGWLDMSDAWESIENTRGDPRSHLQKLLTQWLGDKETVKAPHTLTFFLEKVVRGCGKGQLAKRMETELMKNKPSG